MAKTKRKSNDWLTVIKRIATKINVLHSKPYIGVEMALDQALQHAGLGSYDVYKRRDLYGMCIDRLNALEADLDFIESV